MPKKKGRYTGLNCRRKFYKTVKQHINQIMSQFKQNISVQAEKYTKLMLVKKRKNCKGYKSKWEKKERQCCCWTAL